MQTSSGSIKPHYPGEPMTARASDKTQGVRLKFSFTQNTYRGMAPIFSFTFLLRVSLLGHTLADYNIEFIQHMIQQSRVYHSIIYTPIFVGSGVDPITVNKLSCSLHADADMAQYIFTADADPTIWNILRIYITDDTLAILLLENSEDPIWLIVDRRLRKLRAAKMIIVLHEAASRLEIKLLFEKAWKLQFLQVIILHRGRVFSYTPFPQLAISERLDLSADTFPSITRDLKGYNISTPAYNDIPRIFCITDAEGQLHIYGFAYQIFSHFVRRLNATLCVTNPHQKQSIMTSVNMSSILHSIGTQQLEVSMHPYTGIEETDGIIGYPMFKVKNCLILPVRNEIPRYMYVLRPFKMGTWLVIMVAIAYVGFILVWTNPVLSRETSFHERLSRGMLESIVLIAFLASMFQIHKPTGRYFLIYLQVATLGFFLTTYYSNLLGSFFTIILMGEQVNSFQQLISARIPIMAKYYETRLLLQQVPDKLVSAVEHLLVPVNASVMVAHLLHFNTSFAYYVTEERWRFLALQQQYANKPVYRFTEICLGMPRVGYPMRLDSHLEHPMTQFIMDVQMAGLDHYWLVSDFKHALKAGYVRLIANVLPFKALDLYSMGVAWSLLACGWLLAVVVFSIELRVAERRRRQDDSSSTTEIRNLK